MELNGASELRGVCSAKKKFGTVSSQLQAKDVLRNDTLFKRGVEEGAFAQTGNGGIRESEDSIDQ